MRTRSCAVAGWLAIAVLGCVDHREEDRVDPVDPAPPIVAPTAEPASAPKAPHPEMAAPPAEDSTDADPTGDDVPGADPPGAELGAELGAAGDVGLAMVEALPRRTWLEHARVPRETVIHIAARYGVSVPELSEWNGLSPDGPTPKRGRKLRVRARRSPPPRVRLEYETVEGDSWRSIAVRHGVDAKDLRAYNWPYRGKSAPGHRLQIWVDPIVHGWIAAGPDPIEQEARAGIRRGAVAIGSPNEGHLVNGVRIPDGEGYELRLPRSAYGTTHAVTQVVAAMAAYHEATSYGLLIELGAMSRPTGGDIGTHLSHQTGRDLDVRLPRRETVSAYAELTLRRVDWAVTWELVKAFASTDTMVIFLDYDGQKRLYRAAKEAGAEPDELSRLVQYPRGRAAVRGLVRHIEGHTQHMHVRFGCGPYEPECTP